MNHKVRRMKGKSFLEKTSGLRLEGLLENRPRGPHGDLPGKPLTTSSVSETLSEEKETGLFQLFMAS